MPLFFKSSTECVELKLRKAKCNINNNDDVVFISLLALFINMALKVVEKLSKCKDLEKEINRMWNMKTIVIPVVIRNLGMIRKTTDKWIKQLPGTPHIEMLQKIALLGTAHILRKVLSIKTV